MKKYDPYTREYVTEAEYERRYHKRDSHLCRGKKPHDFVLVLPLHVNYGPNYNFNPREFYAIMDEIEYFERTRHEMLAAKGIKIGHYIRHELRLYMCSVCKKQKYEEN